MINFKTLCTIMTHNGLMMKRIHTYLTDDQHRILTEQAKASGQTVADHIRRALDWHLAVTSYTVETMDMLQVVHPEMTPEQIVAWLMFRWRLAHEGKDYRNGNGNQQTVEMLEEILAILRRNERESVAGLVTAALKKCGVDVSLAECVLQELGEA